MLTRVYKLNLYRMNITTDTIYYVNEDKTFRLSSFKTLASLSAFGTEVSL